MREVPLTRQMVARPLVRLGPARGWGILRAPALAWLRIVRFGLVQASIGAIVVFATSTLNRVMVVEFALPAIVPGFLVSFHYAVQMLRPRWGYGSDRQGRRTPWIVGGMALLAGGSVLASVAAVAMKVSPIAGFVLAVPAFALIGIGVGAAGTALLVLLAKQVEPRRRAAAATLVWMMMIAGFIVTAAVVGHVLNPFSAERLVLASAGIAGSAFVISAVAIWKVEHTHDLAAASHPAPDLVRSHAERRDRPAAQPRAGFGAALREVWAEAEARRFTLFVFFSMLAYSAQELIIEPFAGTVMKMSPADSAKLAGLQHGGLLAGMITVAVLGSVVGGPRLGSMRLWTTAGCLASALALGAVALAGLEGTTNGLRAALFGLGLANGAFSIAAIGAMMQLAGTGHPGREGVRMGLWGGAQALAFALGGLVGTSASDLARHLLGKADLAYGLVFVGGAMLFCGAASLAARAFPNSARPPETAGPRVLHHGGDAAPLGAGG